MCIPWVWLGRIGEYRLRPSRLRQYLPPPSASPPGIGWYCLNLSGLRRYSPIRPRQTHGILSVCCCLLTKQQQNSDFQCFDCWINEKMTKFCEFLTSYCKITVQRTLQIRQWSSVRKEETGQANSDLQSFIVEKLVFDHLNQPGIFAVSQFCWFL